MFFVSVNNSSFNIDFKLFQRWLFFKSISSFATICMGICVVVAISNVNHETLLFNNYQWRAAWIGILISWGLLSQYLIR